MQLTKIICTIGPSSWSNSILNRMYKKGMTAARINASFADFAEMKRVLGEIRKVSPLITTILDLKGHKIRLNDFGKEPIKVKPGEKIIIGTEKNTKSKQGFFVTYKNLAKEIKKNSTLLIDDGKIVLKVINTTKGDISAKVVVGGEIKRLKTVTTPGTKLNFPTLSEKDKIDLKNAIKLGYDYVALSFVRNKKDLLAVKKYTDGTNTKIISKIEDPQGIENFDEILKFSDAIMIARGDMALEIPLEKVPVTQLNLIQKCREASKPVIVATQMLDSMTEVIQPTRAEINDVAMAVLQGTDAMMLSGETSTGKHPVEAVKIMSKIAKELEKFPVFFEPQSLISEDNEIVETIALSATDISRLSKAAGYVVFTGEGQTVRSISKYRNRLPIVVFTKNEAVARQINLSYASIANVLSKIPTDRDEVIKLGIKEIQKKKLFKKGKKVVFVSGISGIPQKIAGNIEYRKI